MKPHVNTIGANKAENLPANTEVKQIRTLEGLKPDCLSLCKCSPRFNLWRVQPDVLCNDVFWGMTRASREVAAGLQMLLSEREQVVV